jgi:hypothetical protein
MQLGKQQYQIEAEEELITNRLMYASSRFFLASFCTNVPHTCTLLLPSETRYTYSAKHRYVYCRHRIEEIEKEKQSLSQRIEAEEKQLKKEKQALLVKVEEMTTHLERYLKTCSGSIAEYHLACRYTPSAEYASFSTTCQ